MGNHVRPLEYREEHLHNAGVHQISTHLQKWGSLSPAVEISRDTWYLPGLPSWDPGVAELVVQAHLVTRELAGHSLFRDKNPSARLVDTIAVSSPTISRITSFHWRLSQKN